MITVVKITIYYIPSGSSCSSGSSSTSGSSGGSSSSGVTRMIINNVFQKLPMLDEIFSQSIYYSGSGDEEEEINEVSVD